MSQKTNSYDNFTLKFRMNNFIFNVVGPLIARFRSVSHFREAFDLYGLTIMMMINYYLYLILEGWLHTYLSNIFLDSEMEFSISYSGILGFFYTAEYQNPVCIHNLNIRFIRI